MAYKWVDATELNKAIRDALDEYNADIVKGLKKNTEQAMKDLVRISKANANVGHRRRHYRDNITSRTNRDDMFGLEKMWYVSGSDYRLTHLLNHGHAIHNGGRYEGSNFLGRSVDEVIPKYIAKIEELIKNGG